MGTIRIGTLFDFRRKEHSQGVADQSEGTKSILARPAREIITEDQAEKDAFFKMIGVRVHGKITAPTGTSFVQKQTSPDYFIFCASTELSRNVQAEFESTDACIEINDVRGFLEEVTGTLHAVAPVHFEGIYEVRYSERIEEQSLTYFRDFDPTRGHHPALIKEPSFRRQKEVRAIWRPTSGTPPKPLIILSRRLPQYCRDVSTRIA